MLFYKTLSDRELTDLLVGNDEKAFSELYNRYWQKMLIKAFNKLDSHTDAEEVVQDSFANLWNRRQKLKLKYSFHTYIASVIRYEIMTKIAAKKQFVELSDLESNQSHLLADYSTEQWLSYEELRDQIEGSVKDLPEKCRLVYKLSREEGFSIKQISSRLKISPKTVEAHMNKALKTLKLSLN